MAEDVSDASVWGEEPNEDGFVPVSDLFVPWQGDDPHSLAGQRTFLVRRSFRERRT